MFPCETCPATFPSNVQLFRHIEATHMPRTEASPPTQDPPKAPKTYTCHECGQKFSHRSGMHRHVKIIHRGEKEHACPECGKAFRDRNKATSHFLIVHRGIRDFKCKQCGQTFGERRQLRLHKATVHVEGGKFKCEQCTFVFAAEQALTRHMSLAHKPKMAFKCVECDKAFLTMESQQQHFKFKHEKKKLERAPSLVKMEKDKEAVIVIEDAPAPDPSLTKPSCSSFFNCDKCGMRFSTFKGIQKHKEFAHPPALKLYNCAHCLLSFLEHSDLMKHKDAMHSNGQSITCGLCPLSFTCKKQLIQHFLSEHEELPLEEGENALICVPQILKKRSPEFLS